jgi:hypothetical protein
LHTISPSIVALNAFSLSFKYFSLFLYVLIALSIAEVKSLWLKFSNENPEPSSESHLNSITESLRPPVLKAITGVLPTKNSCYTIPPGSKADGINPKSVPLFTKEPSEKNSSGAAQN